MRGHRCHSSLSMPALLQLRSAAGGLVAMGREGGREGGREERGSPSMKQGIIGRAGGACNTTTRSLVFVPTVLGQETTVGERSSSPVC
ncbi:hypothetical protein BHM03_00011034 [Ensete ventricosum]|uniref:Secreted protein n=1 Tax=Ensete ventricosum TaxID=4639 RepID=A0A445MD43_ENSVE|nr:hypothetical protein BHM03_00011034 [Ensete ventricosum]